MGYTKIQSYEQLNPGLPKWIIIHDTDSSDIISMPIGSGNNVAIQRFSGGKISLSFLEAGHSGTLWAHTKKNATFGLNSAGAADDVATGNGLMKGILAFLTDNNPGSSRVLEILPNTVMFDGVNVGTIVVDWDKA